jgi:hypothetical protein
LIGEEAAAAGAVDLQAVVQLFDRFSMSPRAQ